MYIIYKNNCIDEDRICNLIVSCTSALRATRYLSKAVSMIRC